MSRGDYSAFPRPHSRDLFSSDTGGPITHHGAEGMTIREYAAIAALQSIGTGSAGMSTENIAALAVELADALLAELTIPAHQR